MNDDDNLFERHAEEHLAAVGPKVMLLESVEGLIESAIDRLAISLGQSCGCDPAQTNDYAAICFRMALDSLVDK